MSWTEYWATGGAAAQPKYEQIKAPNGNCWIGCGPTAWTMLFCWADYQAHNGNAYWAPRKGLYRQNGGTGTDAVAPLIQDSGVENVMREIHGYTGTYCWQEDGATLPNMMWLALLYLINRANVYMTAYFAPAALVPGLSFLGYHSPAMILAIDSIVNRKTPAIIGIGFLEHYPLAFGYRWQQRIVRVCVLWIFCWDTKVTDRMFYVNQGQGDGGAGDWVNASTWFYGGITP